MFEVRVPHTITRCAGEVFVFEFDCAVIANLERCDGIYYVTRIEKIIVSQGNIEVDLLSSTDADMKAIAQSEAKRLLADKSFDEIAVDRFEKPFYRSRFSEPWLEMV